MLILAVTSATASVGVAIAEFDPATQRFGVLAQHRVATDRRHAEELIPMIASVLDAAVLDAAVLDAAVLDAAVLDAGVLDAGVLDAGVLDAGTASAGRSVTLADIDRFAVDVGPGRFTGLRVGLATVRTLAFATATPVTGVSSLEALAAAHPGSTVSAVIDARRAEVFQQRFMVDEAGQPTALGEPFVGEPADFLHDIGDDDLVVGDGADRYGELYGNRRVEGCEPSPVDIARLAAIRPGLVGAKVVPLYLREPDVQINIKTRHNT